MPNVKQAIRDTAAILKDADRASARRRAKGKDAEQRKHHASFLEVQRRYRYNREALLTEYTWMCPYCDKVQEPHVYKLQHRDGVQVVARDRCGCAGEAQAMEQERVVQAQHRTAYEVHQWLAYMRRAGLVGWLAKATFDSYKAEDYTQELQKQVARRYCKALLAGTLDYKPWLIFYGPYGVGKTHLAAAIMHAAMQAGWEHCRLRVWPEWLETLQATFDGNGKSSAVIEELKRGRLVVIDDIDKQHPSKTGWAEEKLYTALNHRYNSGHPTILTFNREPTEMAPWLGKAIVDRMIQVATCLEFGGDSYRSGIDWEAQ